MRTWVCIRTFMFATRLRSNMKRRRKSVSEIGFVGEDGNGLRARIYMNRKYTSGPKRPTRELAYADSDVARVAQYPTKR